MKGSFVEVGKRETALNVDHSALKANYSRFLGEHESVKCYLAEKTSEAVKSGNEAALQAKTFAKAMKLFGLPYRMEEDKGIRVGREECKSKYVVEKPLPKSSLPKLVENVKLSLCDIELENEAVPCKNDSSHACKLCCGFCQSLS